ncbi:MAG: hypothetical protein JXQ90_13610 [Cyclobacteriaceae bacterium]
MFTPYGLEFLILQGIVNLIAWPIAYFIMDAYLNNFASRIDIGVLLFVAAGTLVLLKAVITVDYKTLITAKSNPVKALRYE